MVEQYDQIVVRRKNSADISGRAINRDDERSMCAYCGGDSSTCERLSQLQKCGMRARESIVGDLIARLLGVRRESCECTALVRRYRPMGRPTPLPVKIFFIHSRNRTRSRPSRVRKIKHFDSAGNWLPRRSVSTAGRGCFRKVVSIRNKFVPDWRHQSALGLDGPGARALMRGSARSTDPVL